MAKQKRILSIVLIALVMFCLCAVLCPAEEKKAELKRDYNVKPVPFSEVQVGDDFWTPRLDNLIKVMAAAQWEDGYLYTFYSIPQRQPEKRWTNIGAMHEMYCAGHMYEGAAAHYQVTGDKSFLNIATKNADHRLSYSNTGDSSGYSES